MKTKLTRLLAMCLSVLMIFSLVPTMTFATEDASDEHSHPVCGAEHNDIGDHTGSCEDLVWQPWDGSDMDPDTSGVQLTEGNWYLPDDVEFTERVKVSGNVNLCFNGKFVKSTGTETFETLSDTNFNICDCSENERKFTVNDEGLWVLDDENGTETLIGGGITGIVSNGGVAVAVEKGTCRMYGGNIVGNLAKATPGYGVIHAEGGVFAMYGGNITGNVAEILVMGYYRGDNLYIYGGKICNNIVSDGAVCIKGNIYLSGEFEIYNNINTGTGMSCDLYDGDAILCGEPSFANPIFLGDTWITVTHKDGIDISEYVDKFKSGTYRGFVATDDSGKKISVTTYKVTQNPEKDNDYTVNVNNEENAKYKWYGSKSVVITPEMGTVLEGYVYDEETDLWSFVSDDNSNGNTIIDNMYLEEGETIKFSFPNKDYSDMVYVNNIEDSGYTSSSSGYEYSISKTSLYTIRFSGSRKPDFRAVIIKSSEELADQTSNVLDTTSLKSGYYKCKVIWDNGTSDNEKDDVSVNGIYTVYYADSISGELCISGKPVAGKTLKVKYNGIDQVTYQWYRDNEAITDATGKTYTLTEDDIGAIIKVVATSTNGFEGEVSTVTTEILAEDPNPEEPDYPDEKVMPRLYCIENADVEQIAKTFEGVAEVTKNDNNDTVIKLTEDIFGSIFVDGRTGNIIIDLNGKTITPDFLNEGICNEGTNVKITVTGSGTIKKGCNNSIYGRIYFAVEDGKEYYNVIEEDGDKIFFRKTTTDYKSTIGKTIVVTQNMFTDYIVKFNKNGGMGSMSEQIINVGEATALSANTFTNFDMKFAGWATSADGEVEYRNKEVVTDITTKGQEITLYAVWVDNLEPDGDVVSISANIDSVDVAWNADEAAIIAAAEDGLVVEGTYENDGIGTLNSEDYIVTYDSEAKQVVITLKADETIKETINVNFAEPALTAIELSKGSFELEWGTTVDEEYIRTLVVSIKAKYEDGSSKDVSDYTVTSIDTEEKVAWLKYGNQNVAITWSFINAPQSDISVDVDTIEIPYGTKVADIAAYIKNNVVVKAVYADGSEGESAINNFAVAIDGRANEATITAGDYAKTIAVTYATSEEKLSVPESISVPTKNQKTDETILAYIIEELEGKVAVVDIYGEENVIEEGFEVVYSENVATVSYEDFEAEIEVKFKKSSGTWSPVYSSSSSSNNTTKPEASTEDKDDAQTEDVTDGKDDVQTEDKNDEATDTGSDAVNYTDVADSHWAKDAIYYVSTNGLMNGVTADAFAPDAKLTRAMLATILYRAEGEPATNRSIPFADVDMGAYYANAVSWAKQVGIVTGVTENTFAPDANITREQLATIMFRYAQYKGMNAVTLEENLHFDDSNEISEFAVSAMNWAVGTGLMKGKTETTINPKDNTTRAETAAILQRFIENNK